MNIDLSDNDHCNCVGFMCACGRNPPSRLSDEEVSQYYGTYKFFGDTIKVGNPLIHLVDDKQLLEYKFDFAIKKLKETPKALLLEANGIETWIPKSCVISLEVTFKTKTNLLTDDETDVVKTKLVLTPSQPSNINKWLCEIQGKKC